MKRKSFCIFLIVCALSLTGCNLLPFGALITPSPTPLLEIQEGSATRVVNSTPTFTAGPSPAQTPEPTMAATPSPTASPIPTETQTPMTVRAVRIDYPNFATSRDEVVILDQKLRQAGVNLVALGAGRLDWNYFIWPEHPEWWSGDVKDTGIDFLAEEIARFRPWAKHINIVVDVFASRYLENHPEAAAISAQGVPSTLLVSTMQLVEGEFGQDLLSMLDYLAANYPVDSISITELAYRVDGYGEDDKAAYLAYTGQEDWPRRAGGKIDIDHASIGEWRSYEISRFIEKAAEVVHKHGKELFVDVNMNPQYLKNEASEYGQNYRLLLKYADRLVVWDYFGLSGQRPEKVKEIADFFSQYGSGKTILSFGLWAKNGGTIKANQLRLGVQAGLESKIPHLWITPSHLMNDDHWQVLIDLWGTQS